jgi:hypothetical protein
VDECNLVLASPDSFRPLIGVTPSEFTKESFTKTQKDEAIETLTQNAGRILRGSGHKVVWIHNSDPDRNDNLGEYLKHKLELTYKSTPIIYRRVEGAKPSNITNFARDYINGKVTNFDSIESETLEQRRNKHVAYNKLSPLEQAEKRKALARKKGQRLAKKIKEAKQEGLGWKYVHRQIRDWKGVTAPMKINISPPYSPNNQ